MLCALAMAAARSQERAVLDLRIGSVDGNPAYQFDKIGGVHVFPNGEIAVLDNGSTELRVFSSTGSFRRRISRAGDGPGEFRAPGWLTPGLRTVAVTGQAQRSSLLRPDGTVDRTLPLIAPGIPRWTLLGETTAGWVARQRVLRTSERRPGQTYQDSALISTVDPRTGLLGRPIVTLGFDRRVANPAAALPPLFDGHPAVGVDTVGRIYVTDATAYVIRVFAPDGRVVRVLRPAHSPRTVTPAHIDSYAERVRQFFAANSYPDAEAQMRRLIDGRVSATRPTHLPATGRLLVAATGALWIERADLADDPAAVELRQVLGVVTGDDEEATATRWDRFDSDGRLVGTITLPGRFRPYVVTETTVTGVLRDSLDVELVVRYRVDRSAAVGAGAG